MDSAADNIRVLVAAMVEKANSGHPGGAMGAADFVNVLYSSYLVTDPDDPTWIARDRFFLDPGHMSPMLYSVLALCGYYTLDELQQFRQWGSITPGHPELDPALWLSVRRLPNDSSQLVSATGFHTRHTLSYPTAAFRKKSARVPDALQATSDSATS